MPMPSSETAIDTYVPASRPLNVRGSSGPISTVSVRMRISPPSGIASRALTSRLRIDVSNCVVSTSQFGRSPARSYVTEMCPPIVRAMRSRIPCASTLRLTTRPRSACLRENASSCCVRFVAFSTAFAISATPRATFCASGSLVVCRRSSSM